MNSVGVQLTLQHESLQENGPNRERGNVFVRGELGMDHQRGGVFRNEREAFLAVAVRRQAQHSVPGLTLYM